MGKIVGWRGVSSEEPVRSADEDERERALEEDELKEGEALVDGEVVGAVELFDDDIAFPEDEGLAWATNSSSLTEQIGRAISDLELISYSDAMDYYCDISDASFRSIKALIINSKKRERLDYVRILSEVLGVAQRQAGIARSRNARLRSPNLNALIAFIDEKASSQD